jgi:nicotinate phosphoribosyltransferase
MWGVGTHLTTAYDQPALDGVYKLTALRPKDGELEYKLKLSDTPHKISNPGQHQIRRYFSGEKYIGDVLYDLTLGITATPVGVAMNQSGEHIDFAATEGYIDLLQPIFEKGKLTYTPPTIHTIRAQAQIAVHDFYCMHGTKEYVIALEEKLYEKKMALANELRK